MTMRRRRRIHDVLAKRQPDLTVLAEEVHKPHNLSAILRSCDAVGIGTVHAVKPTGGVATFSATSASADKWVELVLHDSVAAAVATLKASGMRVFAAHLSEQAVDYRTVDYTSPCAVLLGNEKEGVSPEAAALADEHVIIPMLGMVQSLNVSVAAAVILFEAQRQRLAAGRYDRPALSEAELATLTSRWLPRWARDDE
ncbi:MAG: tRNA (guanosine(18)-2'-O)-methyltransferase TrmH [Trueperaceae bacterium]|nr:tRNA (guanosine(18)-2'-O)-methyltransferase TrmH [Trueperaceae bacterium]